jgi:WD40 repeat protein
MKVKKFSQMFEKFEDEKEENILPDISGHSGDPLVDISVSNDGKKVVGVDGRIHVWDLSSGRKIRSFYTPTKIVSVSFTNDNNFIVSGNAIGMIQVWNVDTGKIVRNFLS